WQHELTGEIALWIELGLPDERRIRKACGRARRVRIYTYGGRTAATWWQAIAAELARFDNLEVINIPKPASDALTHLCQRNMQLSCTVQENQVWLSSDSASAEVTPERWL